MKNVYRCAALSFAALSFAGVSSSAQARSLQNLHRFTNDLGDNSDGAFPKAGLIIDSQGALYGTTYEGGDNGYGTAFKLTPTPKGPTAWTETVLYSFCQSADCIDGSYPEAGLTADAQGNLYGTTYNGGGSVLQGTLNFGTVFQLTPPAPGQTKWTEKVLYAFTGLSDGAYPVAGLLWLNGELYGTAYEGGDENSCLDIGCGTVFKLAPTANPPWKLTVIHTFHGSLHDGAYPRAGLIADPQGNLYGTTYFSGGMVFELTPPKTTGGDWTETVIHKFFADDVGGSRPVAGLVLDPQGNLYGTTSEGGTSDACGTTGCGTVFELSPPATNGGNWTATVLHSFTGGSDGAYPEAGLIRGKRGGLYGTAEEGGDNNYGTVFKLTPPGTSGGNWTTTVLHTFASSANGQYPLAGLAAGPHGSLYGTTYEGGYTGGLGACGFNKTGCGTVFKLGPPQLSNGQGQGLTFSTVTPGP